MKKFIALLMAVMMILTLAACGSEKPAEQPTEAPTQAPTQAPTEAPTQPADDGVMSHEEYMAAEMESPVVVEFYVQATQGWWFKDEVNHGVITVYGQDADGGYFSYDMLSTKQTAEKLVPGTKIRVTGYKTEWSGEVEIAASATYVIVAGDTHVAEPVDVTALLGTDELIKHQNEKVCFKGMVVEAANDEGAAFLYKWNGSGQDGDDLYFKVSVNGATYTFCVESYLCGKGTETYEAVKALKVGDAIDVEGFLYWYEGVQPHVTNVTTVEVTPVPAA